MDDDATKFLREILSQQTKQTELLEKHLPPLWMKIRFSLFALMILMTLVAVGLGFGIVAVRSLTKTRGPMMTPPQRPGQGTPAQSSVDDLFGPQPAQPPPQQQKADDIFG